MRHCYFLPLSEGSWFMFCKNKPEVNPDFVVGSDFGFTVHYKDLGDSLTFSWSGHIDLDK